jgi:hypothetical protein
MSKSRFVLALVLVAPAAAFVAFRASEGKTPEGQAARQVVIVLQDAKPFKVERQQMVRLTGEGIAGSRIAVDVDGPAKVVAENSVLTMKGGHILIGVERVEFVIRPTGCGMVKVKITATFLNNAPTVKDYEFEVK